MTPLRRTGSNHFFNCFRPTVITSETTGLRGDKKGIVGGLYQSDTLIRSVLWSTIYGTVVDMTKKDNCMGSFDLLSRKLRKKTYMNSLFQLLINFFKTANFCVNTVICSILTNYYQYRVTCLHDFLKCLRISSKAIYYMMYTFTITQ